MGVTMATRLPWIIRKAPLKINRRIVSRALFGCQCARGYRHPRPTPLGRFDAPINTVSLRGIAAAIRNQATVIE
jgi:hypothetical protein